MDLNISRHKAVTYSVSGSYNHYKTAFDFIDEGNFAFYINTPLGVDFLGYLKKQNKKLWVILAQNERNINCLTAAQKQYLLKTFNSFYLNNASYNAYVEITTEKDKERFNHILRSKYGDMFLTKLAKEYPGLHHKFVSTDFKIEFLRDTDCTAFLILFNQFFKNKCKNIAVPADIARTSPAMAKKLAQSKQTPRAYFAVVAPASTKKRKEKVTAKNTSPSAKNKKQCAAKIQKPAVSKIFKPPSAPADAPRVTDEAKLKDFCKFYDEAMAKPTSLDKKAAETAAGYLKIEESSELRYFMRGLKYAGIEEPNFAQDMFGAYIIEDCKSDMVWAYEKRLFKQWGYDPDNTSVLQDKKTGKILFFDKRQIINYGRTTESMYEQILASANTAAESYNASLEFMFRQVRQGNAYIEAERKFKEKYGPNTDVALTYIQHKFYTGSSGALAGGKYTAAKDINLTGFKQTLFNLISYRINKEGLQLTEKSYYMLLATGVFLKLDFVKGPKTLDNIKRCLAGAGQISFKKPGTQNDITSDAENPPAFAARKICDAVIDIEGEKGFAAHFADSFSAHAAQAGSTLKLFTDATAGAFKGLLIDMPKVMIDCGLNPLLAPLFFFNLTTPEGFASLKQEFFEKMKSTNTGEVAAYISFNAAMAVGMLKHGGEMAKHGIKSIKELKLKLRKDSTTVIINGTEYADPGTVDYVLHYATENKWRSTKFEVRTTLAAASKTSVGAIRPSTSLRTGESPAQGKKSAPSHAIKPRPGAGAPAKARPGVGTPAKARPAKKTAAKRKTVETARRAVSTTKESAPKPGKLRTGGIGTRIDAAREKMQNTSRRYHHKPAKEASPEFGKPIGAANLSVEEPAWERPGIRDNGKAGEKAVKKQNGTASGDTADKITAELTGIEQRLNNLIAKSVTLIEQKGRYAFIKLNGFFEDCNEIYRELKNLEESNEISGELKKSREAAKKSLTETYKSVLASSSVLDFAEGIKFLSSFLTKAPEEMLVNCFSSFANALLGVSKHFITANSLKIIDLKDYLALCDRAREKLNEMKAKTDFLKIVLNDFTEKFYSTVINSIPYLDKEVQSEFLLTFLETTPCEILNKHKGALSFLIDNFILEETKALSEFKGLDEMPGEVLTLYINECNQRLKELKQLSALSEKHPGLIDQSTLARKRTQLIKDYYLDILDALEEQFKDNEEIKSEALNSLPDEILREERVSRRVREISAGKLTKEQEKNLAILRHNLRAPILALKVAIDLFLTLLKINKVENPALYERINALYEKASALLSKHETYFAKENSLFNIDNFEKELLQKIDALKRDAEEIAAAIKETDFSGTPESIKYIVETIKNSAEKIKKELNETESSLKLDKTYIQAHSKRFNLKAFIDEILIDYANRPVKGKPVKINTEKIPENLEIYANKQALTEIIRNLIDDAITVFETTDKKISECIITIEAKEITANGKTATKTTVSDNGPGVHAKRKESIFTGDSTTGGGFGLQRCTELAQSHNGRIYEDGAFGRGAKFVIELPSKQGKPAEARHLVVEKQSPQPKTAPAPAQKLKAPPQAYPFLPPGGIKIEPGPWPQSGPKLDMGKPLPESPAGPEFSRTKPAEMHHEAGSAKFKPEEKPPAKNADQETQDLPGVHKRLMHPDSVKLPDDLPGHLKPIYKKVLDKICDTLDKIFEAHKITLADIYYKAIIIGADNKLKLNPEFVEKLMANGADETTIKDIRRAINKFNAVVNNPRSNPAQNLKKAKERFTAGLTGAKKGIDDLFVLIAVLKHNGNRTHAAAEIARMAGETINSGNLGVRAANIITKWSPEKLKRYAAVLSKLLKEPVTVEMLLDLCCNQNIVWLLDKIRRNGSVPPANRIKDFLIEKGLQAGVVREYLLGLKKHNFDFKISEENISALINVLSDISIEIGDTLSKTETRGASAFKGVEAVDVLAALMSSKGKREAAAGELARVTGETISSAAVGERAENIIMNSSVEKLRTYAEILSAMLDENITADSIINACMPRRVKDALAFWGNNPNLITSSHIPVCLENCSNLGALKLHDFLLKLAEFGYDFDANFKINGEKFFKLARVLLNTAANRKEISPAAAETIKIKTERLLQHRQNGERADSKGETVRSAPEKTERIDVICALLRQNGKRTSAGFEKITGRKISDHTLSTHAKKIVLNATGEELQNYADILTQRLKRPAEERVTVDEILDACMHDEIRDVLRRLSKHLRENGTDALPALENFIPRRLNPKWVRRYISKLLSLGLYFNVHFNIPKETVLKIISAGDNQTAPDVPTPSKIEPGPWPQTGPKLDMGKPLPESPAGPEFGRTKPAEMHHGAAPKINNTVKLAAREEALLNILLRDISCIDEFYLTEWAKNLGMDAEALKEFAEKVNNKEIMADIVKREGFDRIKRLRGKINSILKIEKPAEPSCAKPAKTESAKKPAPASLSMNPEELPRELRAKYAEIEKMLTDLAQKFGAGIKIRSFLIIKRGMEMSLNTAFIVKLHSRAPRHTAFINAEMSKINGHMASFNELSKIEKNRLNKTQNGAKPANGSQTPETLGERALGINTGEQKTPQLKRPESPGNKAHGFSQLNRSKQLYDSFTADEKSAIQYLIDSKHGNLGILTIKNPAVLSDALTKISNIINDTSPTKLTESEKSDLALRLGGANLKTIQKKLERRMQSQSSPKQKSAPEGSDTAKTEEIKPADTAAKAPAAELNIKKSAVREFGKIMRDIVNTISLHSTKTAENIEKAFFVHVKKRAGELNTDVIQFLIDAFECLKQLEGKEIKNPGSEIVKINNFIDVYNYLDGKGLLEPQPKGGIPRLREAMAPFNTQKMRGNLFKKQGTLINIPAGEEPLFDFLQIKNCDAIIARLEEMKTVAAAEKPVPEQGVPMRGVLTRGVLTRGARDGVIGRRFRDPDNNDFAPNPEFDGVKRRHGIPEVPASSEPTFAAYDFELIISVATNMPPYPETIAGEFMSTVANIKSRLRNLKAKLESCSDGHFNYMATVCNIRGVTKEQLITAIDVSLNLKKPDLSSSAQRSREKYPAPGARKPEGTRKINLDNVAPHVVERIRTLFTEAAIELLKALINNPEATAKNYPENIKYRILDRARKQFARLTGYEQAVFAEKIIGADIETLKNLFGLKEKENGTATSGAAREGAAREGAGKSEAQKPGEQSPLIQRYASWSPLISRFRTVIDSVLQAVARPFADKNPVKVEKYFFKLLSERKGSDLDIAALCFLVDFKGKEFVNAGGEKAIVETFIDAYNYLVWQKRINARQIVLPETDRHLFNFLKIDNFENMKNRIAENSNGTKTQVPPAPTPVQAREKLKTAGDVLMVDGIPIKPRNSAPAVGDAYMRPLQKGGIGTQIPDPPPNPELGRNPQAHLHQRAPEIRGNTVNKCGGVQKTSDIDFLTVLSQANGDRRTTAGKLGMTTQSVTDRAHNPKFLQNIRSWASQLNINPIDLLLCCDNQNFRAVLEKLKNGADPASLKDTIKKPEFGEYLARLRNALSNSEPGEVTPEQIDAMIKAADQMREKTDFQPDEAQKEAEPSKQTADHMDVETTHRTVSPAPKEPVNFSLEHQDLLHRLLTNPEQVNQIYLDVYRRYYDVDGLLASLDGADISEPALSPFIEKYGAPALEKLLNSAKQILKSSRAEEAAKTAPAADNAEQAVTEPLNSVRETAMPEKEPRPHAAQRKPVAPPRPAVSIREGTRTKDGIIIYPENSSTLANFRQIMGSLEYISGGDHKAAFESLLASDKNALAIVQTLIRIMEQYSRKNVQGEDGGPIVNIIDMYNRIKQQGGFGDSYHIQHRLIKMGPEQKANFDFMNLDYLRGLEERLKQNPPPPDAGTKTRGKLQRGSRGAAERTDFDNGTHGVGTPGNQHHRVNPALLERDPLDNSGPTGRANLSSIVPGPEGESVAEKSKPDLLGFPSIIRDFCLIETVAKTMAERLNLQIKEPLLCFDKNEGLKIHFKLVTGMTDNYSPSVSDFYCLINAFKSNFLKAKTLKNFEHLAENEKRFLISSKSYFPNLEADDIFFLAKSHKISVGALLEKIEKINAEEKTKKHFESAFNINTMLLELALKKFLKKGAGNLIFIKYVPEGKYRAVTITVEDAETLRAFINAEQGIRDAARILKISYENAKHRIQRITRDCRELPPDLQKKLAEELNITTEALRYQIGQIGSEITPKKAAPAKNGGKTAGTACPELVEEPRVPNKNGAPQRNLPGGQFGADHRQTLFSPRQHEIIPALWNNLQNSVKTKITDGGALQNFKSQVKSVAKRNDEAEKNRAVEEIRCLGIDITTFDEIKKLIEVPDILPPGTQIPGHLAATVSTLRIIINDLRKQHPALVITEYPLSIENGKRLATRAEFSLELVQAGVTAADINRIGAELLKQPKPAPKPPSGSSNGGTPAPGN